MAAAVLEVLGRLSLVPVAVVAELVVLVLWGLGIHLLRLAVLAVFPQSKGLPREIV